MKNNICFVIFFSFIWIILCEKLTLPTMVFGAVVSTGCLIYCKLALPKLNLSDVCFKNLIFYPFFLIGEIYVSGISAIKRIVLADANVEIVNITTQIKSHFLKVVLMNSITLTPGTISIDLGDDKVTILWLHSTTDDSETAGSLIKGKLEKMLLKAQK